ncbi:MAG: aminoacyl-tRNA hydrolase [Burkholderiales bacterium]|jgi:PTH1 family peptidyl-tRNA hydrolase|nr:aminoacyl-tRNA hydrolase [Burkholderiales bacterium]
MKLLVGLGNPGREHEATRHNAGFWFVERVARAAGVALRVESRFHGLTGKVRGPDGDCHLLLPTTYMNASGRAVGALARFHKIDLDDILVVHDELDLPAGGAKLRRGGGAAGHNGIKDIVAHLGADFWRLRLGIGHPGDRAQVIHWVLQAPRREEQDAIDAAIDRALDVWPLLLAHRTEEAMLRLHTKG